MMKMRVTYTVGSDKQPITEVIEVRDWGQGGAKAALMRMYPNRQINIISCQEIH